jgi:outer membrane protein assembly factor BamB
VFAAGGYYGGFDAYRASTGAKTWSNEYASGNYTAAPAADDRYVYAFSRYGSYESRLVAADRATGQVAFTILYDRADGNAYPAHLMSPALDGRGRAFVIGTDRVGFSTSNALHAFDLDGRRVAWSTRGGFSGYLAFNADLIAAPELDQLTFIDHATGTRLWSWDGDSNILGNAVLTDHHALVSTLTATYAIDLDSHQVAWSAPVGGMLALTDDLLVISSRAGVYAYSVPEPSALPAAALAAFATRRTRRTPRTPR